MYKTSDRKQKPCGNTNRKTCLFIMPHLKKTCYTSRSNYASTRQNILLQDPYLKSQHALHRVGSIKTVDAVGSYASSLLPENKQSIIGSLVFYTGGF